MSSLKCLVCLLAVLCGCDSSSANTPPAANPPVAVATWTPRPCPPDQVNLIAMGDWGANNSRQKQVAKTLASYAGGSTTPFNALLTLGDNFYVSLKDTNDPYWQKLFESMYDSSRLSFPFYAALGNHDDTKRTQVELSYQAAHPDSRWKMPSSWYRVDFPQVNPLVTVLILDSDQKSVSREDWARQTDWLRQQLAGPRARWTICCGHHPLFSNGRHADSTSLQKEWGELFKQYRVDFYLSGHDHGLQHLEVPGWPMEFVVSGGGGAPRTEMKRDDRGPFARKLYGFVHLEFHADSVRVRYVDGITQQVVHEFSRKITGEATVLRTLPPESPDKLVAAGKARPGAGPLHPIANAIAAGGDDYQQMQQILALSAEQLDRFKAMVKLRETTRKQWAASDAGLRLARLTRESDAARKAGETARVKELAPQLKQSRAEEVAMRRDMRRQFVTVFTERQLQRWAGHRLYHAVISHFEDLDLTDEQKQQAYAICAVLGAQSATPAAVEKDPYLKPDHDLVVRADAAISEHVLADEQKAQTD